MAGPFRILVLTTSRADFGIYRSVLDAMQARDELAPELLVTGMHLSEAFGMTVTEIRASGRRIAAEVACLEEGDAPADIARSMGAATRAVAGVLEAEHPDLLMVLGDRYEMMAGALAAVPFGISVAHLHGGEETEGAMDNVLRHALTKISHLHFCATELSARRIRQMGEAPDRVIVSGAPALDSIASVPRLSRSELAERFGLPGTGEFALITYHPVTLDLEATDREIEALFDALDRSGLPVVFTAANADTAGRRLNARIEAFVADRPQAMLIGHMGAQGYYSAMEEATLMIGNSSSGILEAASLGLAVINIGERQKGRERSGNVIDVEGDATAIETAIATARSDAFQAKVARRDNVYGDGKAGERIAGAIAVALKAGLSARKPFRLMEESE